MRSRLASPSILVILFLWSDLFWVIDSSILNAHVPRLRRQVPPINAEVSPSSTDSNNETWKEFPFTVAVDQSSPTPEWLQFSDGGKSGTSQQSLVLLSLIGNLSATFAASPIDVMNDMSSVGGQDVNVTFKLTPKFLTGESFSSAMDKLASYVKRWGSKELDFEIGTGPGNATTEGVFKIRLGQDSSDERTSISSTSEDRGDGSPAGLPSSPPTGTGSLLGTVTPLSTQSTSASLSQAVSSFTGPSTGLPAPVSNASQPLDPHHDGSSPAASSNSTENKAATAGAAAAAGIFAAGGGIAAAITAAGEAASAAVVASGGDSAAADAAKAAAEEVVKNNQEEEEEEEEEEDRKLSLDSQRGTSATSGSTTPATTTPVTTLPVSNSNIVTTSPATNASVITGHAITLQVTSANVSTTTPPTTTPVTLLSNGTILSNRTMTSQVVSSSCAACATCPGFSFGAGWPDLGSTTSWADSDTDTEDDWDADIDDDEFSPEDAHGEEGDVPERRALGGRFSLVPREKRRLHKRITQKKLTNKLGSEQCQVSKKFISKPAYYNAANVVEFEAKPPGTPEQIDFMDTLKRWAIPIDVPPMDCVTVPSWVFLSTAQCLGQAPLPDGSTFSNIQNDPNAIWAVGAAPIAMNREVNIDHVYEAKYLNDLFEDLQVNQKIDCDDLKTVFDSADGSTLTTLFANLPSKTNAEFIGMAKVLNTIKEAVTNKDSWTKVQPLSWDVWGKDPNGNKVETSVGLMFTTFGKDLENNVVSFDAQNDLAELTRAAQVLDVMNTPDGIAYMSAPNDRIYKALQSFGCQGGYNWADLYKSYILDRFAKRNVQLLDLFTKVLDKIGPNYRPEYMAAWKQRYPLAKMILPPPTDWANDYPAILQTIQAQFATDPASLNKRQAVAALPAAAACLNANANANANATAGNATVNAETARAPVLLPTSATSTPAAVQTTPAPLSTIGTSTSAAAVTTPATSQENSPTTSAVPSNGDPCGPTIQDNPNYPNTCAAQVNLTTTPEAYGVYCGADGPSDVNWGACAAAYAGDNGLCQDILWDYYPKGAWVWKDLGAGCAIGAWMPTGTNGKGAGAALTPSQERCEGLIFKAMTDSCSTVNFYSDVASVNVASLPSWSDLTQTGSQVNVGYPSFVIAGKSPRGLTELPDGVGWSTAPLGPNDSGQNANDQWELTSETIVEHGQMTS